MTTRIPYVDGPLAGTDYEHTGDGPPPPGAIVDPPPDPVPVMTPGDPYRISITRRSWLYELHQRPEPPGWEYRIAAPDSPLARQWAAEQEALVRSVLAGLVWSLR